VTKKDKAPESPKSIMVQTVNRIDKSISDPKGQAATDRFVRGVQLLPQKGKEGERIRSAFLAATDGTQITIINAAVGGDVIDKRGFEVIPPGVLPKKNLSGKMPMNITRNGDGWTNNYDAKAEPVSESARFPPLHDYIKPVTIKDGQVMVKFSVDPRRLTKMVEAAGADFVNLYIAVDVEGESPWRTHNNDPIPVEMIHEDCGLVGIGVHVGVSEPVRDSKLHNKMVRQYRKALKDAGVSLKPPKNNSGAKKDAAAPPPKPEPEPQPVAAVDDDDPFD
jgi:hypothetical protein